MIKVLIVDDHAVVRRGLKQILDETADIVVAGEAKDGVEMMEKLRARAWDVLVLDITMPGRSGLDLLPDVKKQCPHLPVLMLSMHAESEFATRVLKSGASGYLAKDSAPEELVTAIRKIYAGGKYISPAQAENLLSMLEPDSERPPHEKLSDREFEVLCLIGRGKTLTEMGEIMKLSIKTVSTYRARLLEKMNLHTNAELARYAIKNRLVE